MAAKGQPGPSLHWTRLRRVATGRSLSQAFGLATVLGYHRCTAETNQQATIAAAIRHSMSAGHWEFCISNL